MLKRTLISLAVPAMLATGLLAMGGSASAAAAPPPPSQRFECKLGSVDRGHASLANCRYRDKYVHWIRCENGPISVELTERFNGRRNVLNCPNGYRLKNQSIGL
ncbi:hypothetical protein AB0J42_19245 [Nonomuraea sp. NPDC049649]|uniref:hypothetical protein n=1 Tax=Nonomuraea sp. NPDC049649 TaxID=3155776 RepID=UPI003434F4DB